MAKPERRYYEPVVGWGIARINGKCRRCRVLIPIAADFAMDHGYGWLCRKCAGPVEGYLPSACTHDPLTPSARRGGPCPVCDLGRDKENDHG